MTEDEKQRYLQTKAAGLQLLYRVGQKSKGRMLNGDEMRQCFDAVEEFMDWWWGPIQEQPQRVATPDATPLLRERVV